MPAYRRRPEPKHPAPAAHLTLTRLETEPVPWGCLAVPPAPGQDASTARRAGEGTSGQRGHQNTQRGEGKSKMGLSEGEPTADSGGAGGAQGGTACTTTTTTTATATTTTTMSTPGLYSPTPSRGVPSPTRAWSGDFSPALWLWRDLQRGRPWYKLLLAPTSLYHRCFAGK